MDEGQAVPVGPTKVNGDAKPLAADALGGGLTRRESDSPGDLKPLSSRRALYLVLITYLLISAFPIFTESKSKIIGPLATHLPPQVWPFAAFAVNSVKRTNFRPKHQDMNLSNIPLYFEPNQERIDSEAKFVSRQASRTLFLTPTEAVVVMKTPKGGGSRGLPGKIASRGQIAKEKSNAQGILRMQFVGAESTSHIVGLTELPGKSNYLLGNDAGKWRKNVPHYAKVKYEKMYPGIDLVFYGNDQELEYDFVVAPGADPNAITLAFRGPKKIEIDPNGDLWIEIADKRLKLRKPKIYQDLNNQRRTIQGGYIRKGPLAVGFQVAKYDPRQTLVIDPVVVFSTFLGGSRLDRINAITVDRDGNIYVAGSTTSADFPTENALDASFAGGNLENTDAFVAKLNSSGTELMYSTYLGGSRDEFGDGIAVDQDGNAFVTGTTLSSDFPTTAAAYQLNRRGDEDVFVAKLDASGSTFVYSTYLGGSCSSGASTTDYANGIAVDGAGNVYVTGTTECHDFPTTLGAAQSLYGGGFSDAFITKINASGTGLIYSSFIGGRSDEEGNGLALDQDANVYVTGFTGSLDFPVTSGAFQTTRPGEGDGFVTKLNSEGSAFVYSTYVGGSQAGGSNPAFDWCQAIAVDTSGNAYVTGHTSSLNFPLANAIQTKKRGTWDAFITAINSTGTALIYSTYMGGSGGVGGDEEGLSIAVDSLGRAYVTGQTPSADFPVTADAIQPSNGGGSSDIFVTVLGPDGTLSYSSYLGGNQGDAGSGISVDRSGNLYIGGWTESGNFPIVNALEPTKAAGRDGIVVKLSELFPRGVSVLQRVSSDPATDHLVFEITVSNNGPGAATGVVLSAILPPESALISVVPDAGSCDATNGAVRCDFGSLGDGENAAVSVTVRPEQSGTLCNSVTVTADSATPKQSTACISVILAVHDLAVLKITAPSRLTLTNRQPGQTKVITVQIQNRSDHVEVIQDATIMGELVVLEVQSLGSCPNPTGSLFLRNSFPIKLKSKQSLTVQYSVTFDCANDPLRATPLEPDHTDFRYRATVNHGALSGIPDIHAADNICPRSVVPPYVIDLYPDGKIKDRGCGNKKPDGTLGAEVLTDIVLK